jgi:hypothetical protein
VVPVAFQGGHLASPDPLNGDFSIRGLQWLPSGTSRVLQIGQRASGAGAIGEACFDRTAKLRLRIQPGPGSSRRDLEYAALGGKKSSDGGETCGRPVVPE